MSENKNIEMQVFNGVDYDTLYPKTIAEQVSGIFSSSETISNETLTKYGIDSNTIPDSVFNKLSVLYQYNWLRVPSGTQYVLLEGTATTVSRFVYTEQSYNLPYCDNLSISNTGELSMVNQKTGQYEYYYREGNLEDSTLIGKYIKLNNMYYYFQTNSTMTRSKKKDGDGGYDHYVNFNHIIPISTTNVPQSGDIVFSTNRNAYPDNGTLNNFTYTFLGIPMTNAQNAISVETGSYTGTGTYGSSSPNVIRTSINSYAIIITQGNGYTGNGETQINLVKQTHNTEDFKWYRRSADTQCNSSGVKYNWIAFGILST